MSNNSYSHNPNDPINQSFYYSQQGSLPEGQEPPFPDSAGPLQFPIGAAPLEETSLQGAIKRMEEAFQNPNLPDEAEIDDVIQSAEEFFFSGVNSSPTDLDDPSVQVTPSTMQPVHSPFRPGQQSDPLTSFTSSSGATNPPPWFPFSQHGSTSQGFGSLPPQGYFSPMHFGHTPDNLMLAHPPSLPQNSQSAAGQGLAHNTDPGIPSQLPAMASASGQKKQNNKPKRVYVYQPELKRHTNANSINSAAKMIISRETGRGLNPSTISRHFDDLASDDDRYQLSELTGADVPTWVSFIPEDTYDSMHKDLKGEWMAYEQ